MKTLQIEGKLFLIYTLRDNKFVGNLKIKNEILEKYMLSNDLQKGVMRFNLAYKTSQKLGKKCYIKEP